MAEEKSGFNMKSFKKKYEKKIGQPLGFVDPITWISTGNHALNRMISGDFHRGVPLGAVTVFAGESGSAKSYLVSANIVKNALEMGINVVLVDTEGGLTPTWLRRAGVDPDHEKLMCCNWRTTNEIAQCIRDVMEGYLPANKGKPREEQARLLFVVDSLGFVGTEAEIAQFENGDLKGDKGIKAKVLKMLVLNCLRLFNGVEVGLVATNHSMKSQDQYKPDDLMTGGQGFIYAASILVMMNKLKLKGEVDGKKSVVGIRSKIKVDKSRYSKPFEEVEVEIPWAGGMDPMSGFMEMAEQKKRIVKDGNGFRTTFSDGTEFKGFRKQFTTEILRRVMDEWQSAGEEDGAATGVDLTPPDLEDEDDAE